MLTGWLFCGVQDGFSNQKISTTDAGTWNMKLLNSGLSVPIQTADLHDPCDQKQTVRFWYKDPVKVMHALLNDPIYKDHMHWAPQLQTILLNHTPPAGETDNEKRRFNIATAGTDSMSKEDFDWWKGTFPEDFERFFDEFNSGMWWQKTQQQLGNLYTVGGLIFYSDETFVHRKMSCYPVYSKYLHICNVLCVFVQFC
jgi:hypothetical protein